VPIAARAVSTVADIVLGASRNTVSVEFASVGFDAAPVRYQFRLDDVDADWSVPTTRRVVDYPRLPAGTYRLQVRSLNEQDAASAPAVATFRVLQPFWRTWQFMSLTAAFVAMGGGLAYRQRVARRRALDRVRQQVAHDLHDEVGSGLAQIAVLSEVAKRQGVTSSASLTDIADVARHLRESMTDIIWAVDPRRDSLADLVARMRQVAENLVDGESATLAVRAPRYDRLVTIDVPADRRRHLLLIFKEAMTNAARHSGATRVGVDIAIDGGDIAIVVDDNGRGFDPAAAHEGSGVASMRQRAAELAASFRIHSSETGTRIELRARFRE
jgi:signal transduction histidine kinase